MQALAEACFFLKSSLFERTWKTTIELAPLSESIRFSWNNFFEILVVGICSRCPANCSKQPFGAGLCPETRNIFPSEDFAFWRPKSTEVICNRFHAGEAAYKASCVETSEHPPVQAVQVSEKRVSTISRSSFCWNWSLSWECVGQKLRRAKILWL